MADKTHDREEKGAKNKTDKGAQQTKTDKGGQKPDDKKGRDQKK